ncbi:Hint domain-containing protein [Roseovarius salis]|uniref:Hint domain-containing protein n=1 Tax=Roseovarius salis TaxID=3376063 RepID=UPI0037C9BF5B
MAGTRVATHQGWRPVESLMQGDLVATFDSGFQPLEAITQHRAWIAATPLRKRAAPLHVARGVLRNRRDMMVLPGQPVMIESDAAERLLGDPFAVVPARALLGLAGVEPWQLDIPVDILVLRMARDELVYVDGGALVLAGAADAQGQNPGSRRRDTGARYGVLGGELAQLVVQLQGGSDFGLPGDAA